MKYHNKTQIARQKYLQGLPLSEGERKLIDKDLSGNDFLFFQSDVKPFILPDTYSAENTYDLIEKRINNNKSEQSNPFRKYIGYAAALLIVALFSTFIYNYVSRPEILYASTSYGEKKEIVLPDGSTVILNNMSLLEYPDKMTGKTREVRLKGEAYFDVIKDPLKTFIVKVDDMDVKVLGTRFNIKAYENQEYITITLFEGKVSVGNMQSVKNLIPGEQATYNKETGIIEALQLKDASLEEAWRNNILAFDNQPLSDILDELSRQYNVTFTIDNDDLKQLHITARFSSSEPVDNALSILGESSKFMFTKQGKDYKIETRE